ncbi:MAG: hypothetical protein ACKOCN_09355, partial [Planctomycetaceae bacterium]
LLVLNAAQGAGPLGFLQRRPSKLPVKSWPMPQRQAGPPMAGRAAPPSPAAKTDSSSEESAIEDSSGESEDGGTVTSDVSDSITETESIAETSEAIAVPEAPEPPANETLDDSTSPVASETRVEAQPKPDRVAQTPTQRANSTTTQTTSSILIPGTGIAVKGGGDDFEDEGWKWNYRHPKSSEEQDEHVRGPIGTSVNKKWFEGMKRGTPDLVKRIELPAPGLAGSTHGLLLATLHAGIPGRVTYTSQQDDFVFDSGRAVGGSGMSVLDSPSIVTRVYLPPFEQWERRAGASFGFRAGCFTHAIITGEDHPDRGEFGVEEYWPGMFICFEPGKGEGTADSAFIRIRGGRNGREIRGPSIDELGWWTLGLSFSPDGQVHYFASPGVDDLTAEDHMSSQFPYGYRTERVKTFFYNVCTRDDGQTWSTPWVIDDPQIYFVKRPQLARQPQQPTRSSSGGARPRR